MSQQSRGETGPSQHTCPRKKGGAREINAKKKSFLTWEKKNSNAKKRHAPRNKNLQQAPNTGSTNKGKHLLPKRNRHRSAAQAKGLFKNWTKKKGREKGG